jgi:hypothetical protein
MATNFEAALLRLKGALQVQTDKDIAVLLGMSPTALNDRKRRDAFPVDKVRALSQTHHFDADYVITGVAQAALEVIEAVREGRPLTKVGPEDQQLLAYWHECSPEDQKLLLLLLKRLRQGVGALQESGTYKIHETTPAHVLHESTPKG